MKIQKKKRVDKFFEKVVEEKWDENEYIEIMDIGQTNSATISLVYYVEKNELFVIKKFMPNGDDKLRERELSNYRNISYPLFSAFYGTVRIKKHIIIEYINSETLNAQVISNYSKNEIITIIIQLILVIQYLHKKGFAYRDLKPSNVMINSNKTVVLIDFDQMKKITDISDEPQTMGFSSDYVAPELNYGMISYKCDIYSLGKIIQDILLNSENKFNNDEKANIENICKKCIIIVIKLSVSQKKLMEFLI